MFKKYVYVFLIVLFLGFDVFVASQVASNKNSYSVPASRRIEEPSDLEDSSGESQTSVEIEPLNKDNHEHVWVDGVCTGCGAKCGHSKHDSHGMCSTCGKQVSHKYVNGICDCGKQLNFYEDILPRQFYETCVQQGTVDTVQLTGYLDDRTMATKSMEVYLPYGYDPVKQYDVMFLEGGLGHTYNAMGTHTWMITPSEGESFNFRPIDLYDNLIMYGICEPMIIVAIDGYSKTYDEERWLDGYDQTAYFLRNTIYPYVVGNYSTYATSPTMEAIQAARSHFGLGGFSNGGYLAYWGGMRYMLDICSNFLPIAGSIRGQTVALYLAEQMDEYQIDCVYSCVGKNDGAAYQRTVDDYNDLLLFVPYLEEGKNAWFTVANYGHDWNTAATALYNGLQVMFPNT